MKCQCPLGLIPHFYDVIYDDLTPIYKECQCPLGLIPHFYAVTHYIEGDGNHTVSMPSRAYTSFLL